MKKLFIFITVIALIATAYLFMEPIAANVPFMAGVYEWVGMIEAKAELDKKIKPTVAAIENFNKGEAAYKQKDFDKAFKLFELAAAENHAFAQFYLGRMYGRGEGVEKNLDNVVRWIKSSAEMGNSYGQLYLSDMYEKGRGVELDADKAIAWLIKSAENLNGIGQWKLGFRYLKGNGVAKNSIHGLMWFMLSAEQGNATGKYFLENQLKYRDAAEIEAAKKMAKDWMEKRKK